MKKALIVSSFLIISVLLLLTGCGTGTNITGHAVRETEQTIGVILPLSGDLATYGENAKKGIELALEGSNIRAIIEDGKCEGTATISLTGKLAKLDKVKVIISAVCDDVTAEAAPVANELGVAIISPKNPNLSKAYSFNTNTTIGKQLARKYTTKYGGQPGPYLAETYDTTIAVINAIQSSNSSPESIKNILKNTEFEGTAGKVQFKSF